MKHKTLVWALTLPAGHLILLILVIFEFGLISLNRKYLLRLGAWLIAETHKWR